MNNQSIQCTPINESPLTIETITTIILTLPTYHVFNSVLLVDHTCGIGTVLAVVAVPAAVLAAVAVAVAAAAMAGVMV